MAQPTGMRSALNFIFSVFPDRAASAGWRLVLGLGAVPALAGLARQCPK